MCCRPDDVSLACSNAVSPILLSFAKKGQHSAGFFGQQISRLIYKIGALYASLLTALVSVLSNGTWGMVLGVGFCSMLSLLLLIANYQLGREVAKKIEQVVCTTGVHLFSVCGCLANCHAALFLPIVSTGGIDFALCATDDSGEAQRVRFSYGELSELPNPVQRYFKFCMDEGQPRIKYCHIKQEGHFRYAKCTCSINAALFETLHNQQASEPCYARSVCWMGCSVCLTLHHVSVGFGSVPV